MKECFNTLDKLASEFSYRNIYSIMTEEKANQKEKLSFKMEDINEYFPKYYTPREKSEVILKLLKGWAKRRNKEQER